MASLDAETGSLKTIRLQLVRLLLGYWIACYPGADDPEFKSKVETEARVMLTGLGMLDHKGLPTEEAIDIIARYGKEETT
jgi:hypothetical protein